MIEVYKNLSLEDLPNEIWKPTHLNHRYLISNLGRVKSLGSGGHQTWMHPIIMRQSITLGYLFVRIRTSKKYAKNIYIHRLVAMAFIKNKQKKSDVNHKNGVKLNNHVDNLEWMTDLENTRHSNENGLVDIKGEKNPASKLKANEVLEIYKSTEISRILCKKYNVSPSLIRQIKNGSAWKSTTGSTKKSKKISA